MRLDSGQETDPAIQPRHLGALRQRPRLLLREELLAAARRSFPSPMCRGSTSRNIAADGRLVALHRTRADVPTTIEPSVIADLDAIPLPTQPIVPFVECVHDRIAIEIMRGCPWQCRFCQSTVIKRPLRIREVETIVASAPLESYRNTGLRRNFAAVALDQRLSAFRANWSSELHEVFRPLGVTISVPSLRVNETLRTVAGASFDRAA